MILIHRLVVVRDDIDSPTLSHSLSSPLVMLLAPEISIALHVGILNFLLNLKYACVLSYDCLLLTMFTLFLLWIICVPLSTHVKSSEVVNYLNWCQAMVEVMVLLHSNNTCNIHYYKTYILL